MKKNLEQAGPCNTKGTSWVATDKTRFLFGTLWNFEVSIKKIKNLGGIQYYCFSDIEKTKEEKEHKHCVVYFNNPRLGSALLKKIGPEHLENHYKDSIGASINYVKKMGGAIEEWGRMPNENGERQDLKEVIKLPLKEIMLNHPMIYCQYRSGIEKIKALEEPERYFKHPKVLWLYGKTGCGKSRLAFEAGARPVIYNNGFFSDWGFSKKIVLEEQRGQIPYPLLLVLTDGYQNYNYVNIKGGQKLINLEEIYITSPYHPEDCYKQQVNKTDRIDQLLRRIEIKNLSPENNDVVDFIH